MKFKRRYRQHTRWQRAYTVEANHREVLREGRGGTLYFPPGVFKYAKDGTIWRERTSRKGRGRNAHFDMHYVVGTS